MFPKLKNYENKLGIYLSGGEQKMLALARALMSNPHLLLLDEVCEGLGPKVVNEIYKVLSELKKEGLSILLSDQNARFARKICERAYVLEKGVLKWEGAMEELWKREEILRYLTV
jgi:branched-chain amino acid transport system ATP-binding protein